MEQEIKIVWSTPRTQEFDAREFALNVLGIARENLERDGELLPSVFMITDDSIQCLLVNFADHDEKVKVYQAVIELAKSQSTVALITVNDGFMDNDFGKDRVDSYYPGKLEADGARECIMVTLSGPGIKSWCLDLPYESTESRFVFSDVAEESGGEIGFLDGWAIDHANIH